MKLLALGHSCYLLEMASPESERPFRVLVDPWLTDVVIGDLLGRFPRLRFEPNEVLSPLDAIYISHAHTDHLDPDSLQWLWRTLDPRPTLLLPQSLEYLESLLREHLDGVEIVFLQDSTPRLFRGVSVSGFFNPEHGATNEDDVMVLVAQSPTEVFIGESDAVLPLYDGGAREFLSSFLSAPEVTTACFLTTLNEGGTTMSMLAARDPQDRLQRVDRGVEEVYEEIDALYAPMDDGDDPLWGDERLVRLIGGQGICFPQDLGAEWNRVLFPVRIRDRVRMERELAEQYGCTHRIEEFVPGQMHSVERGRLGEYVSCPGLRLLDDESDRDFDPESELFDDFPVAPLVSEARDVGAQKALIEAALNERFLPHFIGARRPPAEHVLAAHGGEYRIRIRFGHPGEFADQDYRASFRRLSFELTEPHQEAPQEFYWANDVEDFLCGRCDEFSTFCRQPLGGSDMRFWRTLGLPYLNNDLVERKLRFHFERAASGPSSTEWALRFWRQGGSQRD